MSSSGAAKWMEPEEAHAGEVRKLSTLLEASQALSATLDLKEGLQRVLEILGRHHGAIRSTVVLLNEETGEVEVEASAGAVTPGKRVRYRVGEGITGQVVQTGKPIVVPRVSREPSFLHRAAERPELPDQELSYISAPVALDGRTVGAVGIDLRFKTDRDYNRTVKFLGVVGSMIAQAVRVQRLIQADRQRLVDENTHLRQELKERYDFSNIVGTSGPMRQVYEQVAQVARTNTTVLLRGESGTGKELIAHAIHYNSPRAKKPFIKVSCAALPHDLIECELFGYDKGAFTGAHASKKGRFELADGGTLFLDEIGELNLATQVKLLRVLQEREFERLGSTETIRANIRLVAATNKDLEKAIRGRRVPRGPLLPAQRVRHLRAAAAGAQAGRPAPGRLLRREVRARARQEGQADLDAGHRHAGELSLARQRARARPTPSSAPWCSATGRSCTHTTCRRRSRPPRRPAQARRARSRSRSRRSRKTPCRTPSRARVGNRAKAARLLSTTERIFNYRVRRYGIDWRRFKG